MGSNVDLGSTDSAACTSASMASLAPPAAPTTCSPPWRPSSTPESPEWIPSASPPPRPTSGPSTQTQALEPDVSTLQASSSETRFSTKIKNLYSQDECLEC